jgi:hypothetical protein
MKERAVYSIMALVLVLGMALTLATPVGAATPPFTGDVPTDFTGPGILTVLDPGGIGDVGLPTSPPTPPLNTVSGWDMVDFRLTYDAVNDKLYVGINTDGIAGDADGDGFPGVTAAWLLGHGGTDQVNLGGSESIAVYFNLDQDMAGPDEDYDVIVGVSDSTNLGGFTCANFTGDPSGPSGCFGPSLGYHTGTYHATPSASDPDFELTILHFSELPDQDDSLGAFRVCVFMGSEDDNGIGEDTICYEQSPSTNTTITSSAPVVVSGDTVNLTVTEENDGDVPLTNPQVVVTQGGSPLDTLTSSDPHSGDSNLDGILDPAEIWSWTISSDPITTTTTFVATGSGVAPGDFLVTYPDDPDERDEVTVDTINPDTITTIVASESTVLSGDTVSLNVTEENTGDDPLTNPYVTVSPSTAGGSMFIYGDSFFDFSSDTIPNGILDTTETWRWINIPSNAITGTTTFVALGFGTDSLSQEVSFAAGNLGERDEVTIYTIRPDTITTIAANATWVSPGSLVSLTVTEQNTGGVNLTNPYVEVRQGTNPSPIYTLDETWPAADFSGDDNHNGILETTETWTWTNVLSNPINTPTTFEALGFGTDSGGNEVSFAEGYSGERDTVTVYVTGEACLEICKFQDANVNGMWDPGEPWLPDWKFHVTGPAGYDRWVTTGSDGCVVLLDLVSGTYTVTEELKAGWYNTRPGGDPPYEQDIFVAAGPECARVTFGNREEIRDIPPNIPAMNKWGIIAMITLFAGLLVWTVRRKRLSSRMS